ncbi:hypothetical protein [Nostoc sp. JL34]|uniref:hypothetical protein n=2 Tax=Nostoc TaxID=1177 RepID=UPI0025DF61B6|nr:hypothetical protein [Nostoc sp. JL34]
MLAWGRSWKIFQLFFALPSKSGYLNIRAKWMPLVRAIAVAISLFWMSFNKAQWLKNSSTSGAIAVYWIPRYPSRDAFVQRDHFLPYADRGKIILTNQTHRY